MNKLNEQAFEEVGDGKLPNRYFISVDGNVFIVMEDFWAAHAVWSALPRNVETMMEDRLTGAICDSSPREESVKFETYDDSTGSFAWIEEQTEKLSAQ